MKLSEYLAEQITTANVGSTPPPGGTTAGTLKADGTYATPTMVKRKFKRNKSVRKGKKKIDVVNGIMQARPMPRKEP